MKLKIMRLYRDVKMPLYQTEGAAGFDIHAYIPRAIELGPGNRMTIPTGLCFEIPDGYELQIRPRSGLAFKYGLMTSFGTIDSDYRGEVLINLINHGRFNVVVSPGERVAQAILAPVVRAQFEEVEVLSETKRGKNGCGSTGQ